MFLLLAPGYSSFSVAQYYCCTKASVKNLIVVSPITFHAGKKNDWMRESTLRKKYSHHLPFFGSKIQEQLKMMAEYLFMERRQPFRVSLGLGDSGWRTSSRTGTEEHPQHYTLGRRVDNDETLNRFLTFWPVCISAPRRNMAWRKKIHAPLAKAGNAPRAGWIGNGKRDRASEKPRTDKRGRCHSTTIYCILLC